MPRNDLVQLFSGKDWGSGLRTRSFSIHGLSLQVKSNSLFILDAISELLHYFRRPKPIREPEVDFHLLASPLTEFLVLSRIRKEGQLLYDSKKDDEMGLSRGMKIRLRYLSWKKFYVADYGPRGAFLLDLPRGTGIGFFPDPSFFHPGIFSNFVFLIGLSEILRSRALFLIHGAALSRKGKGFLIPGFTGSGKTTLSIALMRAGFQFLSDDRPFLRENGDGFELLAFPEGLDVTEKTISFFPELRNLPRSLFKDGPTKKRFWAETVYPRSILEACTPEVLIFPEIIKAERSHLEPLSRIEAIGRLLPHSLLVFEHRTARKQFHILCRLVEKMDCYCLHFGKDLTQVHRLVEEVLG